MNATRCTIFEVINDNIVESEEIFTVVLTSTAVNAGVVDMAPGAAVATVTILEDPSDGQPTISLLW